MDTTPLTTTLRRALPASLTLAALLGSAAAAQAAPSVGEPIPLGDGDAPKQLAVAADGTLWLTLDSATSDVARVKDGVVTKYNDPAVSGATGITIDGGGTVWITRTGGVSSFTAADPANMTETNIAALNASPRKIVVGRDGNLWTASDDKLVKIPPAAPATFTTRTLPGLSATSIAYASTGELWITNFGGEQLTRVTATGEPTTIAAGGNPQDLAAGAGGQVAVAMPSAPHRVSLRTAAGESAAPLVPGDPFGITYAADTAYWTARFADHSVGRVTATGEVTRLAMPAASGPRYIAAGTDAVWVGLETAKAVLPISGVTAPPAPTPSPAPGSGQPGGTGADTTAPKITKTKLLRSVFRVGIKGKAKPGATPRGTRLSFTINEAATYTVSAERRVRGGRTVARTLSSGSLKPGAARISVSGRLQGGKGQLAPGRYRLRLVAVDAAGNRAKPVTKSITIVRR